MKKLSEQIQKLLTKVVAFTQTKYMRLITNTFMGVSALLICGSIFTLVKSIPISPWQTFLTDTGLGDILSIPINITTDIIALHLVIAFGYHMAVEFKENLLTVPLVALGSFLIMTPFSSKIYSADYTSFTVIPNVIDVSVLGARGVFLAMLVGIFSSRIYIALVQKGIKIKLPDSVPSNVANMFSAILPGGLTFLVFLVLRYVVSLTPFGTAQTLIYILLQTPLVAVGGGMAGFIVYRLVGHILWCFGIHGTMVAYAAMASIISVVGAENMAAFAAGTAVPHPEWALSNLIVIGGSGATLALNLLMLTPVCKSAHFKTLGKLALPTSIFQINEPLLYGAPIIMNPLLAIPFIASPLVNFALCWAAYKIGFLIPTGASISNFIPVGLYGAFATASVAGFVVQVVCVLVDMLIYLPFVKAQDARQYAEEQAIAAKVE